MACQDFVSLITELADQGQEEYYCFLGEVVMLIVLDVVGALSNLDRIRSLSRFDCWL